MARRFPESHGPVRYGPPLPGDGLPVLPELSAVLAAAAARAESEPVGGEGPCSTPPAVTGTGVDCPPCPTVSSPPPAPPPCCSR